MTGKNATRLRFEAPPKLNETLLPRAVGAAPLLLPLSQLQLSLSFCKLCDMLLSLEETPTGECGKLSFELPASD